MGQDPMPGLGLHLGNNLVGLRQLLKIVDAGGERIDIALDRANVEHVQNDLRVL